MSTKVKSRTTSGGELAPSDDAARSAHYRTANDISPTSLTLCCAVKSRSRSRSRSESLDWSLGRAPDTVQRVAVMTVTNYGRPINSGHISQLVVEVIKTPSSWPESQGRRIRNCSPLTPAATGRKDFVLYNPVQ